MTDIADLYRIQRENMVQNQILPNAIQNDAILDAMLDIPRHIFFEKHLHSIAYSDGLLKFCNDRFALDPLTLARVLDACDISKESRVIDIGCGTGYSTFIIARIAKNVVGIESSIHCVDFANTMQKEMQCNNASFALSDDDIMNIDSKYFNECEVIIIEGRVNFNESFVAFMKRVKEGTKVVCIKGNEYLSHITLCIKQNENFFEQNICRAYGPLIVDALSDA